MRSAADRCRPSTCAGSPTSTRASTPRCGRCRPARRSPTARWLRWWDHRVPRGPSAAPCRAARSSPPCRATAWSGLPTAGRAGAGTTRSSGACFDSEAGMRSDVREPSGFSPPERYSEFDLAETSESARGGHPVRIATVPQSLRPLTSHPVRIPTTRVRLAAGYFLGLSASAASAASGTVPPAAWARLISDSLLPWKTSSMRP